MKGQKRFKKVGGSGVGDLAFDDMKQVGDAKDYFRKKMNQTSYAATFGDKPKAAEAFSILKTKKFNELYYNEILVPEASQILTRWLAINDQDMFTGRIYFTVREMYTVIKNQVAIVPTSHDTFANASKLPGQDPPRFDKILQSIITRNRNASCNTGKQLTELEKIKRYKFVDIKIGSKEASYLHPAMRESKYGPIRYDGPPIIDIPAYKQDFLKGDKEVVFIGDPSSPHPSTYANNFKGKQPDDRAEIWDDRRTSFACMTSPDPATMSFTRQRWNELAVDRLRLSRRMFKSGRNTFAHTPISSQGLTTEHGAGFKTGLKEVRLF